MVVGSSSFPVGNCVVRGCAWAHSLGQDSKSDSATSLLLRRLTNNFTSSGCSFFIPDVSKAGSLSSGIFREILMRKCIIWAGHKRFGEAERMEADLSKL